MFRARPSICQCQYGCFLVSSCFVLAPCVRYGYNSFKKILLLCYCVARDTHFSAFIFMVINFLAIIIAEMNVSKITEPNNIISICSVLYMY